MGRLPIRRAVQSALNEDVMGISFQKQLIFMGKHSMDCIDKARKRTAGTKLLPDSY
jgi:hypothetical protein